MSNLTPEEDDILRHHPASPAADKIRAERAKAEWNERAAAEQAKQGAAHARIKELEGKIATNIAEAAARDMRIADLERDLTAKDDALKTANAALTRICEVIGAPVPVCPDDAVEAAKHTHDAYVRVNTTLNDLSDFMRTVAPDALPPWTGADVVRAVEAVHARATTAENDLLALRSALNDAGAPAVYDMPDDTERPIPDRERIRILGARVRTDRAEREQEALRAQRHADYLRDAHVELDYCGAPRHADGVAITPAARIRAYVDMVTTPTEDPSIALREWTRTVWGGDDTL